MNVALLSAGPSLSSSYGPADQAAFDIRIGVNTAVTLFPCDWWVCADTHRFVQIVNGEEGDRKPIGKPRLAMIDGQIHNAQAMHADLINQWQVTGWDQVFRESGADKSRANNSGPAGLVLAKWLGATSIDCFGVDMVGNTDAVGRPCKYRVDGRWIKEREDWQAFVKWLGIPVTIHGTRP